MESAEEFDVQLGEGIALELALRPGTSAAAPPARPSTQTLGPRPSDPYTYPSDPALDPLTHTQTL